MAGKLNPDVVGAWISAWPSLNGIEASPAQIRAALPEYASCLMLSMHSDEGYVLRALKAGAKAYLLKDSAEADLARRHPRRDRAGKSFFQSRSRPGTPRGHLHDRRASARAAKIPTNSSRPASAKILQLVAEANPVRRSPISNLSVYHSRDAPRRLIQKIELTHRPGSYPVRCSQGHHLLSASRTYQVSGTTYTDFQHNRAPPSAPSL